MPPRAYWPRRPAGPPPAGNRTARTLAIVGGLVTTIAAALGLLFTLAPNLKPCLGETSAAFTGAPVFPHVRFHDHLFRNGTSRDEAERDPNLLGAEIRLSYRTSGFRGGRLPITWTLITIERDGTLGAVVKGQDRALATTVTPRTCSESGAKDLFVPIAEARKRYRVVLEFYRDPTLKDRLGLIETAVFRG